MNKEIGKRIQKIRQSKSISPKTVAAHLDILVTSYAKIEREGSNSVATLSKIAEALKVELSDLVRAEHQIDIKETDSQYGFISRAEADELKAAILRLTRELEKLRGEISRPASRKKRKPKI